MAEILNKFAQLFTAFSVPTSDTTAGQEKDFSKSVQEIGQAGQSPIELVGDDAKGIDRGKFAQVDVMAHVISNPDKPFKEYVIVSPDKYKEGLTYHDYVRIYKPILVGDSETI